MMKHILYIIIGVLALTACHPDEPQKPAEQHFRRTVLVYMAMQNSLGSSGYHKEDSAEIANAISYIPEGDRLLLFIDDKYAPRIYEMSKEMAAIDKKTGQSYGPRLLKQWQEDLSSASAATLTEVLKYMGDNFPSDSYGLVMGSHATGWIPQEQPTPGKSQHRVAQKAWGIDVGPDGWMSSDKGVAGSVPDEIEINDLATAITRSGIQLDYLLFDACLMQCVEVAYTLRNATDYLIASPIMISAEGAYYTDLVHYGLFSADPVDVARTYADYYLGRGSIPYTDTYGVVLSCIRTAGMEPLAHTIGSIMSELMPGADARSMMEELKGRNMADAFNYHPYTEKYFLRPYYYDLLSAIKTLGASDEAMKRLNAALNDAVVFKAATQQFWYGPNFMKFQTMPTGDDSWCGVSMFVPQQTYADNAYRCVFGDLNESYTSTDWYRVVYGQ